MNEQRIAQLRQEQQRLSVDYRTAEATLHTIDTRLIQIEDEIRAAASADTAAFVVASVEDRRRQAHAEQERERAERAAANAEWLQLQQQGEPTRPGLNVNGSNRTGSSKSASAKSAKSATGRTALLSCAHAASNKLDNCQVLSANRIAELRARGVTVYQ